MKRHARGTAVLALILCCGVPAIAQEKNADQAPGQQAASAPPKAPQPLFRRHHRGMYRNDQGIDLVDSTPQSPPLETDDPGVPDKGAYEINLTTRADLSRDVRRFDLLFVDANYGLLPSIGGHDLPTQLKFEVPVAGTQETGNPFRLGLGAAAFGVKVNFYSNEQTGVAASVYPQIEFVAPGTRAVEKGLADPGQTIILPLLVAKEFKYFAVVANAGAEVSVHDPNEAAAGAYGVGLGWALTRELAAMIEVRTESAFDFKSDRLAFLNAGLIRGVGGRVLYARFGRSVFSDDGLTHTYVGVGMKLSIQP